MSGDCLTGEAHLEGSPNSANEEVVDEFTPRLRPRDVIRVSAPPLPTDPVVPPDLTCIEPALLIKGQKWDPELASCFAKVGKEIRGMEEFLLQKGVLYRRSRESNGSEVLQVVMPQDLREVLVLLAHEGPMAGYLGVNKTLARLRGNFWWPGMAGDIKELVKSCHTCQMVGKPNQNSPVAPLHPIPAVNPPFTRVPNQLVFGYRVRDPLDLVREAWSAPHYDRPESFLESGLSTREGLVKALEVAPHHLGAAPKKNKRYYDQKAEYCIFAPVEETTEVPGSKLVVTTEHWRQCGVLLGERLQHLGGVQKKKFHCQSEGVTTGVKPRDTREGFVYSIWGSDHDQIEEQLNATPKEHFDTSAEIPEQAPEEGANPTEEKVHQGRKKLTHPMVFHPADFSGSRRGRGRGKGVLGKSASGRFLSRTVTGRLPVSWPRGQRRWWPPACCGPGSHSCCLKILKAWETSKIFPLRGGVLRAPPVTITSSREDEGQAQQRNKDFLRRRRKLC